MKTHHPSAKAMLGGAVGLLLANLSAQVPGTNATDWVNLLDASATPFETVAGNWEKNAGTLVTGGEGPARVMLPLRPEGDYDFRVSFTRNRGSASIALFFTVGEKGQAGFEVDAWNRGLAGIQNIGGQGIPDNDTRSEATLTNGTRHSMQISVRGTAVRGYLDGKALADYRGDGSDLSLLNLWNLPHPRALGLGAYQSATTFHSVELRPVGGGKLVPLGASSFSRPAVVSTRPPPVPPAGKPTPGPVDASGKRVLLVIANQDFFYREYADPRAALEQAGVEVEVAAGRKSTCRPHRNSGYTSGDGSVRPDLALSSVDPERYDAIMFAGGWGSSMYQYAFEGRYHNSDYNGSSSVKRTVNELINKFVEQDKYVAALCHGVSVLAWSRVDGKSLLDGKRVCAYPKDGPPGEYPDGRNRVLSPWNSEINGATVSPSRSVGNPGTDADDVMVDGKVVTGENDGSARAFGEQLARLLAAEE